MNVARGHYSFGSVCQAVLTDRVFLGLPLSWAINDHYLKPYHPSLITGKLSDITSLACTPIIMFVVMLGSLHCFICFLYKYKGLTVRYGLPTPWYYALLSLNAISMGTLMIAINTNSQWSMAYKTGLGYVQWPWIGLWAWYTYGHWPPLPNVHLTVDPSDSWTAPAAFISLLILQRSLRRLSQESNR